MITTDDLLTRIFSLEDERAAKAEDINKTQAADLDACRGLIDRLEAEDLQDKAIAEEFKEITSRLQARLNQLQAVNTTPAVAVAVTELKEGGEPIPDEVALDKTAITPGPTAPEVIKAVVAEFSNPVLTTLDGEVVEGADIEATVEGGGGLLEDAPDAVATA